MSENNTPHTENPYEELELEDSEQQADSSAAKKPAEQNSEPQTEEEASSFASSVTPESKEPEETFSMEPEGPNLAGLGSTSRIADLEDELAQAKDQTLRALAELDNLRKRAAREREDAGSYAITRFARGLLDVADNLRRALDAAPDELKAHEDERFSGLITGIEATERELIKVFEQNGMQKLEPLDEKFDPNFHEVMFEAPMPGKENGTIIQIIEAGYTLKGRLLRPARVGITKNQDAPSGNDGHVVDEEA